MKQGRSSRSKPDPKELKARSTPGMDVYLDHRQKAEARQRRVGELLAWHLEHCRGCDHCQDAREAPTTPVAPPPAVPGRVVPKPVREAPRASEPGAFPEKLARCVEEGDRVLDGDVWRVVLFTEMTDDGLVLAETGTPEADDWVTMRWDVDELVACRAAGT